MEYHIKESESLSKLEDKEILKTRNGKYQRGAATRGMEKEKAVEKVHRKILKEKKTGRLRGR